MIKYNVCYKYKTRNIKTEWLFIESFFSKKEAKEFIIDLKENGNNSNYNYVMNIKYKIIKQNNKGK